MSMNLRLDQIKARRVQIGVSATPVAINTANQRGLDAFFSSTATSGTTYGQYIRLDSNGAGQEAIAGRFKTLLKKAGIGNAHGVHGTLEGDTSAGAITGLGTGIRGNVVVPDRILGGTYFGVMAEIFPLGNSAALPAGSNACLGISAPAGTEMDKVVNAISFAGTDGTGKMIYTHAITMGATGACGIRCIVNGVARWIPLVAAE